MVKYHGQKEKLSILEYNESKKNCSYMYISMPWVYWWPWRTFFSSLSLIGPFPSLISNGNEQREFCTGSREWGWIILRNKKCLGNCSKGVWKRLSFNRAPLQKKYLPSKKDDSILFCNGALPQCSLPISLIHIKTHPYTHTHTPSPFTLFVSLPVLHSYSVGVANEMFLRRDILRLRNQFMTRGG